VGLNQNIIIPKYGVWNDFAFGLISLF